MSDVYTSGSGWAFVQFESGKEVYPLGSCFDADAIPDPKGDRDPIQCLGPNGTWVQRGWNLTPPDKITTTLTGLQDAAATWMEKVKERGFRFNLYITEGHCNTRDVFGAWQRAYIVPDSLIVDDPVTNALMRGATAETEHAFSISAMPGRIDHRKPVVSQIVSAELADLNDVATGNDWREQSSQGPQVYNGQNIIMAAETVAAGIPDVFISRDGLATHTSPVTTFVAGESVKSVCRFRLDCDTVREVAVRDTRAAVALSIEYSDDNWANATEYIFAGGVAAEAAVGAGSMFALDANHIWICTDDGNVWFSSDAAVSFTLQPTAITAGGASPLNQVKFVDADFGVAVGDTDVIIYTLDGGTSWVAGTATGTGDDILCVQAFDAQRIIVGTDGTAGTGSIWQTWDQTATWTAAPVFDIAHGTNDDVFDMDFCTPLSGLALIGVPTADGNVYQTIDGGYSWQRLDTPTNAQLTAVAYIQPNLAYVVGLLYNALSFIARVDG